MMKLKSLILTITTFALVSTSCELLPPPTVDAPETTTKDITNVLATTATFSGDITSDGGFDITERGFVYSSMDTTVLGNTEVTKVEVELGENIGEYTHNVTDLISVTTYYVRAYAINTEGISYGEVIEFRTATASVLALPTITTLVASNIKSTNATLNGNITSAGDSSITKRGFVYSPINKTPELDSIDVTQAEAELEESIGKYTSDITDLISVTTYYVRAYAINAGGTVYGEVKKFRTSTAPVPVLALPTITTLAATIITSAAATLNGNITSAGDFSITKRGFVYSSINKTPELDSTDVTQAEAELGEGIGEYTKDITDLASYQKYYVRAYATNSIGTVYGEVKEFTTRHISISVEVTISGERFDFTVADRNVGASDDGVAYNYTNDTEHSDNRNALFKGSYYTWIEANSSCPDGWRLPTITELYAIREAMQYSEGRAYIADGNNNRCYFPLSGSTEDAAHVTGSYWSDDAEGGMYCTFFVISINDTVSNQAYPHILGNTVRCVK